MQIVGRRLATGVTLRFTASPNADIVFVRFVFDVSDDRGSLTPSKLANIGYAIALLDFAGADDARVVVTTTDLYITLSKMEVRVYYPTKEEADAGLQAAKSSQALLTLLGSGLTLVTPWCMRVVVHTNAGAEASPISCQEVFPLFSFAP